MDTRIEDSVAVVRKVIPEEADTISPATLESLARQVFQNSEELTDRVRARSGNFIPHGPTFAFLSEIVVYLCVIYSIIDVVGKIDEVASLLLDSTKQLDVVDRTILRLKQLGMEYPAKKVEDIRDRILEKLTTPDK
ncbi:hypothetical protein [Rhizobium laguerreae]|uniref:hypothetical protein n=1 Tax=Rhizobium laguerreae TaxID=1076926 RepID=UPI001C9139D6|nr:hypothetical protein [Rhizobium laguerreae]MBY3352785.1 hypothetical protein [Rhizobium laguerreae]MBY3451777.1 hypothetical protein [Rhizobium laguerreae]MBY3458945.1 hypothetical protein [Rhizobium laguerreae]